MTIDGPAERLRIYIGESDTWHGKPLFQAIVQRAREEGLAGATVVRGIEGFGASSRLHTARILRMSSDLPIVIELVDQKASIDRFVPILDDMVGEGLVTRDEIQVLHYRGRPPTDD
ncbi:MAG: DUF190 domain-containing protein [Actinomycetota bacterium]